jgi:phage-related protein
MTTPTFNYEAHQSSGGWRDVPRIAMAEFGDGYEQITTFGLLPYDTFFDFSMRDVDKDQIITARAFLKALRNSKPFYWTPPHEDSATAFVVRGKITIKRMNSSASTLEATFKVWNGAVP